MKMIKKLDTYHHTRPGLLLWCLAELAIAYGLASWSINSGNLWLYVLTVIFFIGALQNFFRIIGTFIHGRH